MNKESILEDLFSRQNRGIKPGLDRIREAAKRIENPQNRYTIIHVAGTNGKGSTSTMIASILQEAGYRTGLFTSPHILEFRERFIIDGIPVEDDSWLSVWTDIQPLCDTLSLTFFEISTLLAFELFARERCEYVVLETGMGGRLDSTNICDPILSVVTALSVEHSEYLGDTIEKIAGEKLGIVKPNRPLVINGSNPAHILDLAQNRCKETHSKCIIADSNQFGLLAQRESGQLLSYDGCELVVPLAGAFQIQNTACAVIACETIGISRGIIQIGVSKSFIPCRLQKMKIGDKQWLFDVAHNPQAIEILCGSLTEKVHFLTGMMKDKEYETMISLMIPHALSITVIKPNIARAAETELLAAVVRQHAPTLPLFVSDSVETAVVEFSKREGVLAVTGSFYTIADVFSALGTSPWNR